MAAVTVSIINQTKVNIKNCVDRDSGTLCPATNPYLRRLLNHLDTRRASETRSLWNAMPRLLQSLLAASLRNSATTGKLTGSDLSYSIPGARNSWNSSQICYFLYCAIISNNNVYSGDLKIAILHLRLNFGDLVAVHLLKRPTSLSPL